MKASLTLIAAAAVMLSSNLFAISVETWVGPPPADGSLGGEWNTAANWGPAIVPNGVGAAAVFNGTNVTANHTITLSANVTIGSLSIDNATNRQNAFGSSILPNATLTFDAPGNGPATLTATGNSGGSMIPNVILLPLVLNDDLVITVDPSSSTSAGGTVAMRLNSITGPGGIIKNGDGILSLADSAKEFAGPLVINAGRVSFNSAPSSAPATSGVTVNAGGQLFLNSLSANIFGPTADTPLQLNGFGPASPFPGRPYQPGAICTNLLDTVIDNTIILQSDAAINQVGSGSLILTNTISGPGKLFVGLVAEDPEPHGTVFVDRD